MADLNAHSTFDEATYSDDLAPVDFDAHTCPGVSPYAWTRGGDPTTGFESYFSMRAWNLITGDFETWTSKGTPNLSPPSGQPIQYLTITEWED